MSHLPISTILVPQGAEYQAVRRGMRRLAVHPPVLSIPAGPLPVAHRLNQLCREGYDFGAAVLLLGLCGGLTPTHAVGDVVLYRDCLYHPTIPTPLDCDRPLTERLHQQLGIPLVRAVTSDRVIASVSEKQQLAQTYNADVVDMEGYVALQALSERGIAVAMARVISDDSQHDLPDLSAAFSPTGSLRPLSLTGALLRRPIAAAQLIRGSLQGLSQLSTIAHSLFTPANISAPHPNPSGKPE
jgi:hypothetical protein